MEITFDSLLFVASSITIICVALNWIWKAIKPVNKAMESPNEIEHIKETVNLLCECELAIMNNIITGNNVDNLKETRDKLQVYVCNR